MFPAPPTATHALLPQAHGLGDPPPQAPLMPSSPKPLPCEVLSKCPEHGPALGAFRAPASELCILLLIRHHHGPTQVFGSTLAFPFRCFGFCISRPVFYEQFQVLRLVGAASTIQGAFQLSLWQLSLTALSPRCDFGCISGEGKHSRWLWALCALGEH